MGKWTSRVTSGGRRQRGESVEGKTGLGVREFPSRNGPCGGHGRVPRRARGCCDSPAGLPQQPPGLVEWPGLPQEHPRCPGWGLRPTREAVSTWYPETASRLGSVQPLVEPSKDQSVSKSRSLVPKWHQNVAKGIQTGQNGILPRSGRPWQNSFRTKAWSNLVQVGYRWAPRVTETSYSDRGANLNKYLGTLGSPKGDPRGSQHELPQYTRGTVAAWGSSLRPRAGLGTALGGVSWRQREAHGCSGVKSGGPERPEGAGGKAPYSLSDEEGCVRDVLLAESPSKERAEDVRLM